MQAPTGWSWGAAALSGGAVCRQLAPPLPTLSHQLLGSLTPWIAVASTIGCLAGLCQQLLPVSLPWMLLGSLCPEFPGNMAGKGVSVTSHTQQPLFSSILHLLGKETQVLARDLAPGHWRTRRKHGPHTRHRPGPRGAAICCFHGLVWPPCSASLKATCILRSSANNGK